MRDGRIPISVLTGFLGAGKTTLLNRLVRDASLGPIAIVINEFGEIGIDHDLVERSNENVIELRGGCLCCTISGDLSQTIRKLNLQRIKGEVPEYARMVIETTGLADPAPILQTLMTDPVIAHDYRLEGVITLVDGVNGEATMDAQVEAVKQAAVADRLVVTKADLAAPEAIASLTARLGQLNPTARLLEARAGAVDPSLLFNTGPYDPRTKSVEVERWLALERLRGHEHDHGETGADTGEHHHAQGSDHRHHGHHPNRHDAAISSFCIRRTTPVPASTASLLLDLLTAQRGPDLLRVKGILHIAETPERPLVIQVVQHVVHMPLELDSWPSADRDTRLVFITRNLQREVIERLVEALLSNEAPAAAGV